MCIGIKRRTSDALKLAQPIKKFTPRSTSCGIKKAKHHITIQHNYHDHAGKIQVEYKHIKGKGGVLTPFPLKLHAMLDAVERQGMEHIVSWQPHGRCFVVHNPKAFGDILSNHFKVSKLSSFQRQLNLYGFQRLTRGKDRGGYYHELFLRGKVFLAQNIERVKIKGTKIRARSNPSQEPNFYSMSWVFPNDSPKALENDHLRCVTPQSEWDLDATPITEIDTDIPTSMWEDEEAQFAIQADPFLEDFDFSMNDNGVDVITDDVVFGKILEQLIAV